MSNEHLPKPIQRALNQIAYSRALAHQMEERMILGKEIDALLAKGLTPSEALEQLRTNPPFVDPRY